jgi:hypothetical protein
MGISGRVEGFSRPSVLVFFRVSRWPPALNKSPICTAMLRLRALAYIKYADALQCSPNGTSGTFAQCQRPLDPAHLIILLKWKPENKAERQQI